MSDSPESYEWRLHYDDATRSVKHLWPKDSQGSPTALCGHARRRDMWIPGDAMIECSKCRRLSNDDL